MASLPSSIPDAKKLFCPHCNTHVPKSTWYRHFSRYYDSSSGTWKTTNARLEADFDFGSDSDCEEIDNAEASTPDSVPSSDLATDLNYEEAMETVFLLQFSNPA